MGIPDAGNWRSSQAPAHSGAAGTTVLAGSAPRTRLTLPPPPQGARPRPSLRGLAWGIFVCDTIVIWAPSGRSRSSCLHSARLK